MKPSELTAADVAVFARLIFEKSEFEGLGEAERQGCEAALNGAMAHAAGYTGLDMAACELHDMGYAVCTMAAEMLDNRQMTAQYTGQNPTVMQILGMHSANLLPGA